MSCAFLHLTHPHLLTFTQVLLPRHLLTLRLLFCRSNKSARERAQTTDVALRGLHAPEVTTKVTDYLAGTTLQQQREVVQQASPAVPDAASQQPPQPPQPTQVSEPQLQPQPQMPLQQPTQPQEQAQQLSLQQQVQELQQQVQELRQAVPILNDRVQQAWQQVGVQATQLARLEQRVAELTVERCNGTRQAGNAAGGGQSAPGTSPVGSLLAMLGAPPPAALASPTPVLPFGQVGQQQQAGGASGFGAGPNTR